MTNPFAKKKSLSSSNFYSFITKQWIKWQQGNHELYRQVTAVYNQHKKLHGAPRITRVLQGL